ncbi:MAG: D-alanine--D-alanine ligase [Bacteroidetes bacterium GWF2_41_31]|nr:MAG: D-alanine--D-alanine ligase [Bacteroidetes bacterium GWF2_41_31]
MTIGLTYDLRSEYLKMGFSEEETAEFDKEDTIEAIEQTLQQLGYHTERIGHLKQLVDALAAGKRWDLVFNIAEGMYGLGREAQVPALLDAYQIPYVFSGPLVLALTLDKSLTKRVIRDAGIPTPDFALIHHESDLPDVNLAFPLFAKPVAEGTGKGINGKSIINNTEELKERCSSLLKEFKQPVLLETYLSGREFTTGITGTGANAKTTGTMEILLLAKAEKGLYSYANKEDYKQVIEYQSVTDEATKNSCEQLALDVFRLLGCEDGGRVDIRMDENGVPNFLEVNPLAGMHPVHSDLPILSRLNGIQYPELMKRIMDSAVQKVKIQ